MKFDNVMEGVFFCKVEKGIYGYWWFGVIVFFWLISFNYDINKICDYWLIFVINIVILSVNCL